MLPGVTNISHSSQPPRTTHSVPLYLPRCTFVAFESPVVHARCPPPPPRCFDLLPPCTHQESKANLSRATKVKRELRLHLANLPKVVAAIESLDALPQDFDLDIGGFDDDDDGDAKRLRLG